MCGTTTIYYPCLRHPAMQPVTRWCPSAVATGLTCSGGGDDCGDDALPYPPGPPFRSRWFRCSRKRPRPWISEPCPVPGCRGASRHARLADFWRNGRRRGRAVAAAVGEKVKRAPARVRELLR